MIHQDEVAHKRAFDFAFKVPSGQPFPLSQFQGHVLLITNTASQCGFTRQLSQLEQIYQKYKQRQFMVIGVPSNNFGHQEPLHDTDLCDIYQQSYNVTFPIMAKTNVKGPDTHPFYQWARQSSGFLGQPRWNFHKFIISPDGHLNNWYSSMTKPISPTITKQMTPSCLSIAT